MADQSGGIVGVVGTRADGCEVVCTLPETSLGERASMVKRKILPHVRSHTRIADGFQLEFPRDPQIRGKLEHWAELERGCCREARFEIDEPAGGLRLTVHGIDPAWNALAELLDSADAPEPRNNWIARITAAGGVGAVGAFLLLCVLPMGLIAVAGASVAGPLARLESPPALAAGTLVIGGGWWWWRRRRSRETAQPGSDCGC